MKKILGLLILLIAIGITLYLFHIIPGSSGTPALKETKPGVIKDISEEWLGIFIQGQRVGYSFTKVAHLESGLEIENRSQMTINMMQEVTTLITHIFAHTDSDYALTDFSLIINAPGHESRIEGQIKDKELTLTTYSQGIKQTQVKQMKENPYFPGAIEQFIKKKNLKPGDEIAIPYFDPTSQSSGQARLKVFPEENVMVFDKEMTGKKIEINFMGLVSYTWLDKDYKVIKNSTPSLHIEMIPLTKEEALAEIKPKEAFDLLSFFSVKVPEPLPEDKDIAYVKLKLTGLSTEGLNLSDDFQKIVSDNPLVIEISLADIATLNDLNIPVQQQKEYLNASAYIQCDNHDIINEAKRIVAGEKSAKSATKKLVQGVYRMLRKVPTPSMPSAVDVLKTREGDCNEHSVLFVALARALGIPAKIYVGLVNLEGDAYFYHAWCAVYLGTWIPVDPTFNQFPADVYHLKLKEGEISDWAEVMKVVGKLKVEVVEYH